MSDWLFSLCAGVMIVGIIGSIWFYQYPHSQVYACNDVDYNPPEIKDMCKRLTKHQWWGTYYGKQ